MPFDERQQKAFDYAAESAKQLITLATAIIALTITFSKDFVAGVSHDLRLLAMIAWAAYGVSVLFGIAVLLALTGELERKQPPAHRGGVAPGAAPTPAPTLDPSIWCSARYYMIAQILTFLVGITLTILFGARAITAPTAPASNGSTIAPAR